MTGVGDPRTTLVSRSFNRRQTVNLTSPSQAVDVDFVCAKPDMGGAGLKYPRA
jgi:hypothetical protein